MRIVLLLLVVFSADVAEADSDLAPVRQWIVRQQSIDTIQADFTQTRALRTLRSPAVIQGKFWFRAPASFRWQVGDPPKMIVLGNTKVVDVINPARKTVGRSGAGLVSEQARSRGFAMMSFPFAADFDGFQRQFETLAVHVANGQCHLELLPRDAQARRFLAKLAIDFETASGRLLAFELVTREGSSMRTEFRNTRVNAPIDPAVFRYDFTGYQVRDAK